MKKIFVLLITIALFNTGCKKYLDKSPSEGGLVGFNNVDQFDGLLNDIRVTRNIFEWRNGIYGSDDCFIDPDFQTASASYLQPEAFNTWNQNELRGLTSSNGFQRGWSYMYTYNYITEKIDAPSISGSALLKKQVKAEAMFFRAFNFFNLATEYCMHPGLNGGQYPGLGYKNTISTDPSSYDDRKTVDFTFSGIIEDLTNAEQLLTEVGKSDFNIDQPWRATVVTVQALRARVELYMGNYAKAFDYAKKAYTAYSFLYDMNNAALFTMQNRVTTTTTCNGVSTSVTSQSPVISNVGGSATDPNGLWNYKENYFRYVAQLAAAAKLPPSQDLYNMYEATDLRKKIFYDNNLNCNNSPFTPCRKDELVSKQYMKHALGNNRSGFALGVSVPEVMLIMAECRARGKGDGENANVILKALRKTRFPIGYIDNIGSTLKDVKDERRRELAFVMRWYDLKRYNALDNDNIIVTKRGRDDVYQLNSNIVTYKLAPNAPAYALPIPEVEIILLGTWPQNEFSGVTKQ